MGKIKLYEVACKVCDIKSMYIRVGKATNGAWKHRWFGQREFYGRVCPHCIRKRVRDEWNSGESKKKAITKIYEKTPKGFVMRLYRNMKSRVTGVQKEKYHLYAGIEILPKEEFYDYILSSDTFKKLFKEYEASGYERRYAPSIDRVDSSMGYTLDNMEIVTMSENSRRGNLSKSRYKYRQRP